MSRFLIDDDGITRSRLHVQGDELVTEEVQDAGPIADTAKALRSGEFNRNAVMRPVASIPITMYREWQKEWRGKYAQSWTWQTYLAMKLNSRDYSQLRTSDLRL